MRASGQLVQQLGLYGDDKRSMELESMDGVADPDRRRAPSGTTDRKEAIIDDGVSNISIGDYPRSMSNNTTRPPNHSSVAELEQLHTSLLATVQGPESLTSRVNSETG